MYRVIDVACGSGDAQTLCITDDDTVWSWGDGDYGKLGEEPWLIPEHGVTTRMSTHSIMYILPSV